MFGADADEVLTGRAAGTTRTGFRGRCHPPDVNHRRLVATIGVSPADWKTLPVPIVGLTDLGQEP